MSETTDFYMSWLGPPAFGIRSTAPPAIQPQPVIFTPLDISDCYIWFNGDDLGSITIDNVGVIQAVANLGQASGSAIYSVGDVTSIVDVNNLNCMNFPSGSMLEFTATLPYQSRTQFVVFKNTTDMSGATYPYLTFMSGGASSMQTGIQKTSATWTFSMCQNGINCPLIGDYADNILNVPHFVMYISSATDLSSNVLSIDGGININTGTDLGNLFTTTEDTYIINNPGPPGDGQGQVICEIIEYGRVITSQEIEDVTKYLSAKWDIGAKPAPPPELK